MRILIVDDEPVLQDVLSTLLRREGFEVVQALTAADALRLAEEQEVDLVLLDLMLPDRPGMEVLKELKHRDPEIAVVVITAYSSVETAITAMREGAFHYIPKPFKNQEVILTVRKGARAAPAAHREPRPAPASGGARQPDLAQPGDGAGHRAGAAGRALALQHPADRRVGHRQGAAGARHPPPVVRAPRGRS